MFYIKEFFKIFRSNFLICSLLVVSIFGAVTTALQKDKLASNLSLNAQTENIPYFNALIHNADGLQSVKRKMRQLPGVRDIIIPKSGKVTSEINYLKQNFDEGLINELAVVNFKRIKIELENGVELKNQNLIKEYLLRLLGKDAVTIGAIKTPRKAQVNKNSVIANITNWAESYLLIFFMTLFTVCMILLKKPLANRAFIIEKFQRRRDVNSKILLAGCTLLFGISILVNQGINRELNIFVLIPIGYGLAVMTFLTFKKKLEYKY